MKTYGDRSGDETSLRLNTNLLSTKNLFSCLLPIAKIYKTKTLWHRHTRDVIKNFICRSPSGLLQLVPPWLIRLVGSMYSEIVKQKISRAPQIVQKQTYLHFEYEALKRLNNRLNRKKLERSRDNFKSLFCLLSVHSWTKRKLTSLLKFIFEFETPEEEARRIFPRQSISAWCCNYVNVSVVQSHRPLSCVQLVIDDVKR